VNSVCAIHNMEPGIRKRGGPTHVDHAHLYPIYEAMAAPDVPVMIYTSPFAGPDPYLVNDMAPDERVLRNLNRLTLVLGHGGYPRVRCWKPHLGIAIFIFARTFTVSGPAVIGTCARSIGYRINSSSAPPTRSAP
jgi:hypothetical protein